MQQEKEMSLPIGGASQPRFSELPESIFCPLDFGVMEDPVITHCGHTFNRFSIEKWLEKNNTCPIDREKITKEELRPNRALKDTINALAPESSSILLEPVIPLTQPVPQVDQDDLVALQLIKGAEELERAEKWEDAEKMYETVLQFSTKSEHYSFLPELWLKMKCIEKAASGFLILANLQENEKQLEKTVASLKRSLDLINDRTTKERYAELLLKCGHKHESAQMYLELAQQALYQKEDLRAVQFCNKILGFFPGFVEAYKTLAALQKDSQESLHILLRGADEKQMAAASRQILCKLVKIKDPENRNAKIQLLRIKNELLEDKIKQLNDSMATLESEIKQNAQVRKIEAEQERAARLLGIKKKGGWNNVRDEQPSAMALEILKELPKENRFGFDRHSDQEQILNGIISADIQKQTFAAKVINKMNPFAAANLIFEKLRVSGTEKLVEVVDSLLDEVIALPILIHTALGKISSQQKIIAVALQILMNYRGNNEKYKKIKHIILKYLVKPMGDDIESRRQSYNGISQENKPQSEFYQQLRSSKESLFSNIEELRNLLLCPLVNALIPEIKSQLAHIKIVESFGQLSIELDPPFSERKYQVYNPTYDRNYY